MKRWVVVGSVLAGCFSPRVATDVPCGPNGECPSGQFCSPANTCVPDGTVFVDTPELISDSPIDADIDAPDAPPDAPPPPRPAPEIRATSFVDPAAMAAIVQVPAGTQVGDLLVAHINADATQLASFTEPLGWTRAIAVQAVEQGFMSIVAYRAAEAGVQSYTFTFPGNSGSVHLLAITGADLADPIENAGSQTTPGTAPNCTTPPIPTNIENTRIFDLVAWDLDTTIGTVPAPAMTQVYNQDLGQLGVAAFSTIQAPTGLTAAYVLPQEVNGMAPAICIALAIAPPPP